MRIAICDSAKSVCDRYSKVFSKNENTVVTGVAQNVEECIKLVKDTSPEILLLNIQLVTDNDGIEAIKEFMEIDPALKVIMLAVHTEEEDVFRIFASGAKDILLKSASDDEALKMVNSVYNGNATLAPEIAEILAKKSRDVMNRQNSLLYTINQITKLSKSELNVLREVYYGKTYREIALNRFVEEGTIRAQASGIMKKFQTKSMKNLIRSLKEMELFEFIDLYYENSGK